MKFCHRHRTHFCPCVKPDLFCEGDERGDPKVWDEAEEKYRAKTETTQAKGGRSVTDEEDER